MVRLTIGKALPGEAFNEGEQLFVRTLTGLFACFYPRCPRRLGTCDLGLSLSGLLPRLLVRCDELLQGLFSGSDRGLDGL